MSAGAPQGSELHPLVGGFRDAAGYDRARPRYDASVVAELVEQLGLAQGAPVLELGAGTGQLSGALLEAGLELTAVEPLEDTRELLAGTIGAERVRAGRAEEIPLPEASVQAVLAADAFHWFDEQRAMPEIKRVLRPGGGVAILRTAPVLDTDWSRELGEMITEVRPRHPAFDARPAAAALEEDDAFGPVRESTVTTRRDLDREAILALIASFSWVATLAPEDRERLLSRAREVLDAHGVQHESYDILHQIWTARLA
ncbi:MAG TPA: class I SAM-dependent methyltransferase [Solirubrobacteraceae bacterium]|jgi:SAM-dependent methyltransferase|nr:class I SAM-dependent methyltransferase [Solirubrobacteraceae bacterium]